MRKAILLTSLFLHSIFIPAQSPVDEQVAFRTLALEHYADRTTDLQSIFSLTDSLGTKPNKIYAHQLDSLASDSINRTFFEPMVEMSKHYYYLINNNNALASASLKKAQPYFDLSETQDRFHIQMNRYSARFFESTGEISFALNARKRLSQAFELLYEGSLTEWKGSADSLSQIAAKQAQETEKIKSASQHDKKVFMQAIAGAGIIVLVLLVILFMSRWSLKKKIKSALNKPKDTLETDLLNSRIEELNNEVTQYKHTAQLTINKLNHFDTSHRKVMQSLTNMKDEVNKTLDEINTQNEQQKANSSPATYMFVRNSLARTASVVEEHIKQTLSLLK